MTILRRRGRVFAVATTLVLAAGLVTAAPAFAAAPTITSFTPTSGKLADIVTITGTNFTSPATVNFNGVAATNVTVTSATRITTRVPYTASTGPITVTTSGGSATSSGVFTVVPGLFTNTPVGPPGSTTKPINYSGFNPFEAIDVYLDTTDVLLSSASSTGAGSATLTLPTTATPGSHYITAVGRRSGYSAQIPFTVRTDWPQFGYDKGHGGVNPYENTLDTSNVGDLDEAWRTPGHGQTTSTPAIVSGVVYAGFGDDTLRAFNEATGTQIWSSSTGGTVQSSPAVSGGIVYIGADDGYLYAFGTTIGDLKWRYPTGGQVFSSPTVAGGIVYFGSYDHSLYALDAATGDLIWSFPAGGTISDSPAVVGGQVYFGTGSPDNTLYKLNAATGAEALSVALNGSLIGSPAVVSGRIYIGTDIASGKVYSIRASNGTGIWSYNAPAAIESTPAVAGNSVYVGDIHGDLFALDKGTGTKRWTTTVPYSLYTTQDFTVENGVVYAGSTDTTYGLSAATGTVLATLNDGSDLAGVTVVDGTVTIADYSSGAVVHYTLGARRGTASVARPTPASLHPNRSLHEIPS